MLQYYYINTEDLPDPSRNPEVLESLPEDRRKKCLSAVKAEDRKLSLGAGQIIHQILSGQEAERLRYGEHGKPEADGICFSISHSGTLVLGVSNHQPVGCDIERVRSAPFKVARRFFTQKEVCQIEESVDPTHCFWQMWTLKESYVKMTGEGMFLPFDAFEITLEQSACKHITVCRGGAVQPCEFIQFDRDGYIISVCRASTGTCGGDCQSGENVY